MHDLLHQLKGARLSVFIALALNENAICLGLAEPLSIRAIAAQTQMSTRHALRAVQDLVAREFVTPMSECGNHREKLYRVSEQVRSGGATATVAASRREAPAKGDTHVHTARQKSHAKGDTHVHTSRKRSHAKGDTQTRVSGSATALPPISSTKPKRDRDNLSGSMRARVHAANRKPKAERDTPVHTARQRSPAKRDTQTRVSRSATALSPISSAKSKSDRDNLSGSMPARVPAAPRGSTADRRDQFSESTTAIAPISSTKSPPPDARSLTHTRTHTHTRPRARARDVVVNKTSTSSSLSNYELELLQQQQAQFEASRAVFAAVPVYGNPLVKLARTVDVDLARAWTERLGDAPKSFTDPVGYLVKHLLDDPTEPPPEAWQKPKKKSLFDADFVKYVHGRPEHAQYCREHPEEVDCVCGKDWCEETGQWVDSGQWAVASGQ